MTNLFTTYESVLPPEIISPDVKQNYLEILALNIPDNLNNDEGIDWSFIELPDESLQSPLQFETTELPTLKSSVLLVIDTARSFVGSKYSWGGTSPSTGFDCSGLLQYAFRLAGIDLPRTAALLGNVGQKITLSEALPGDVIWFGSKDSPSGLHIGLISKIDNGLVYIIDAAGKKLGVVERELPKMQIKGVRRILGGTSSNSFASNVINFFKNKGLTEELSRGILGNLMLESRGNHTVTNKTSGAYGLALWLGPRKLRLFLKYGSNPSMQQLLEFIWEELNTTEKKSLQKLLNTTTVADATRVFAQDFERGGKHEMNMNKRILFAYLS